MAGAQPLTGGVAGRGGGSWQHRGPVYPRRGVGYTQGTPPRPGQLKAPPFPASSNVRVLSWVSLQSFRKKPH